MKMRQAPTGLWVWGTERTPQQFEALDAELETLKSLDLKTASTGEIRKALNAFGRGYLTRLVVVRNPRATAFRARGGADYEPWAHVEELWARKPKDAGANRFNEAGRPVLYSSADPFTALSEIRVRPNSLAVILVMKVINSPKFAQFGFELIPQYGEWREKMGEVSGGLAAEPVFRKYAQTRGIFEYWQIQDRELGRIATGYIGDEEREKYRLSTLLGAQLQNGSEAEGLQYPTAARESKAINMCYPASVARRRFVPTEAWLVAIGPDPVLNPHIETDPGEPIVIRRGYVESDDSIRWGGRVHLPLHALHLEVAPIPQ